MRGQIEFEVNGEALALRFSFNTRCSIEQETGKTLTAFFASFDDNRASFTDIRLAFQHALVGDRRTADQVGDIIDALGDIKALDLLTRAIMASMPAAEPGKAGVVRRGNVARQA